MRNFYILLGLLIVLGLSGCNETLDRNINSSNQTKIRAFVGDEENNKVVIVDIDKMKLLDDTEKCYTKHKKTAAVYDLKILPKLYITNRGNNAIDVMDVKTMMITKTINLQHHPRSTDALNKDLGLIAVTGMDKPMVSIIDIYTDNVVAVVGDNIITTPENSPHACGHPYWLNKNHFVLIDRARKQITTYKIFINRNGDWETQKLNTITQSTTSHQLVPRKYYNGDKDTYYLINEGSDTTYPSVVELKFEEGYGLRYSRQVLLKNTNVEKADMGAHHGDFVANSKLLYVGSKEGMMYIINYDKMEIETRLEAGYGAGHSFMIPERNIAITINHKDKFVTVFDTKNSEIIKDLVVSNLPDSAVSNVTIQAHPSYYVSKDLKYFYMFLSEEADFIKIDLDLLEVVNRLHVGGKPEMCTFK